MSDIISLKDLLQEFSKDNPIEENQDNINLEELITSFFNYYNQHEKITLEELKTQVLDYKNYEEDEDIEESKNNFLSLFAKEKISTVFEELLIKEKNNKHRFIINKNLDERDNVTITLDDNSVISVPNGIDFTQNTSFNNEDGSITYQIIYDNDVPYMKVIDNFEDNELSGGSKE